MTAGTPYNLYVEETGVFTCEPAQFDVLLVGCFSQGASKGSSKPRKAVQQEPQDTHKLVCHVHQLQSIGWLLS